MSGVYYKLGSLHLALFSDFINGQSSSRRFVAGRADAFLSTLVRTCTMSLLQDNSA